GKPETLRLSPRRRLVAEEVEDVGARPYEHEAGTCTSAGEGSVLAEEAVAGMNGVTARFERGGGELLLVEVGRCAPAPQSARVVAGAGVTRRGVVFGVHG